MYVWIISLQISRYSYIVLWPTYNFIDIKIGTNNLGNQPKYFIFRAIFCTKYIYIFHFFKTLFDGCHGRSNGFLVSERERWIIRFEKTYNTCRVFFPYCSFKWHENSMEWQEQVKSFILEHGITDITIQMGRTRGTGALKAIRVNAWLTTPIEWWEHIESSLNNPSFQTVLLISGT